MNMQIFAYTQNPNFIALLEVECKENTGLRPVIHSSLDELKSMLAIFKCIDVLIIDQPEDLSLLVEVKEFILSFSDRVKKIMVLGNESLSSGNIHIFSRLEIADLFKELKSFFVPDELPKVGWTSVPLCTLVHFTTLPFDLFIKISENRYIKRIPAFEQIEDELVNNLESKGITDLHCEKRFGRDFSMMLINNMINKIDNDYSSVEDELFAQSQVFQTTQQIIHGLGLSGRVIEVCETTIDKMCQDVHKAPAEFGRYLLELKRQKNLAFQYRFIILTNYLGAQLIFNMGLPQAEEQVRKLIFSSFFCDMTLKNPNHIFHRKSDDGSQTLGLEEQNEINFHALRASELISTYRNAPKEAALIIRQHHGSLSGIGFPADKSRQLLPLAKILVISQDIAMAILSDEKTPAFVTLQKFVQKNRYPGLQDILSALEGHLLKIA